MVICIVSKNCINGIIYAKIHEKFNKTNRFWIAHTGDRCHDMNNYILCKWDLFSQAWLQMFLIQWGHSLKSALWEPANSNWTSKWTVNSKCWELLLKAIAIMSHRAEATIGIKQCCGNLQHSCLSTCAHWSAMCYDHMHNLYH